MIIVIHVVVCARADIIDHRSYTTLPYHHVLCVCTQYYNYILHLLAWFLTLTGTSVSDFTEPSGC